MKKETIDYIVRVKFQDGHDIDVTIYDVEKIKSINNIIQYFMICNYIKIENDFIIIGNIMIKRDLIKRINIYEQDE